MTFGSLSEKIAGRLYEDRATRLAYATDGSVYRIEPRGVLVARELDDVRAALDVARAEGVPLTMRGAGTSLAGQAVGAGLVVDVARCDRILAIDPEARLARVEPGVIQGVLDRAAAEHGLCFGPDTATANRATVGGMVANDSAGMRSIVYGRTSHRVRRLRVALADGTEAWVGETATNELTGPWAEARALRDRHAATITRRWPRILRCVDGYNLPALGGRLPQLARFLCGSEGTLAVILEIEVELDPRPETRLWSVVRLASLDVVSEATMALLEGGPSAVELVDAGALVGSSAARELAAGADAVLLVEHSGPAAEVAEARRRMPAVPGSVGVVQLEGAAANAQLAGFRRDLLGIITRSVGGGRLPATVIEDAAVPVERLSTFLAEIRALFREEGTASPLYGHASVGLVHARPLLDLGDPEDRRRFRRLAEAGAELAVRHRGALSGEHGDGILRAELLPLLFGNQLCDAFRAVKQAFDPHGILNPGRIVDAPPLDQHLRADADHRRSGLETAASRCIGVGSCVELRAGTMCPPYRVTRDELHSTRGRADLLREALAGRLDHDDPRFAESLELCIGCKACHRECPAGVDFAWLKAQYRHERDGIGGPPRRERAFARVPVTLQRAGRTPRLANAAAAVFGPIQKRLLGIDRERRLPRLAPRSFRRLVEERYGARLVDVALFVDTFTQWLEPQIGIDALDYLEAAGAEPSIAPNVCCGRTYISAGMLDDARSLAEENVRRLLPIAQAGVPIVGLEPSCILTLRDDLPKLVPSDDARTVARQVFLIEEALDRWETPVLAPVDADYVVHPHCHARALARPEATAEALARIGGARVETLDAGCCGMAGAFGYRKEHAAISRGMAEHKLLPALRERPPETIVIAHGTSCRTQLADLGRVRARHPMQILAERLRAVS